MSNLRVLTVLACLLILVGCSRRPEGVEPVLIEDDSEFVLTILLDLSGSFESLMADDGKAYEFALQVLDRYFRDQLGTNSKIIIAQISNTDRSLLWQGTPRELRQQFPTAKAFRDFLRGKYDPNGSRVYDAVAQTVNYVLNDPNVSSGKSKSAMFVLSDMLDSTSDSEQSKQRALQALADYGQRGGTLGLYYVDQLLVEEWRQHARDAGIRQCCVQADIVGRPQLPNFE